jgi:hypothetical protein
MCFMKTPQCVRFYLFPELSSLAVAKGRECEASEAFNHPSQGFKFRTNYGWVHVCLFNPKSL